jgi:glucan 1,3-beta-glucosidase
LVFGAALFSRRTSKDEIDARAWLAIAIDATVGGVLAGWAIENVPIESLGAGGWLRSLAFAALALAAPVAGAVALAEGTPPPAFARILGRKQQRSRDPLELALGLLLIALTVLAIQSALALAFDPRYRDFPFAPLIAAAVPFALIALVVPLAAGRRALAETLAGGVLVLSAVFIAWNETLANWQALAFGAGLLLAAFSLLRGRAAPG